MCEQMQLPTAPPPTSQLPRGARLGKYELIRHLATGGMAEVYLARAHGIEGFQKRVVLKRILPQLASNPEFIAMFLNEARVAAMLDHPNIVQVHDIYSQLGNYYLTMEFVRGQDARTIVTHARRRYRLVPIGCATAIAIGAAAGLHFAHDARGADGRPLGLIHRDVSPSNILVSYDGSVKIVDFGIAKAAAIDTETQTGTLKGKIAYMSPEQCRGEDLDRRSDVFSLGIVLYELVTGARLFAGTNEFAILQKIVSEDVAPPSRRRADLPAELEQIILKALRRDRRERYASAEDLQRALEEFSCEQRLSVSAIALGDYMTESFADAIAAEPSDSSVSSAPTPDDNDNDNDPSIVVVAAGAADVAVVDTGMFAAADAAPRPATRTGWPTHRPQLVGRLLLLLAGAGLAAAVFVAANLLGPDNTAELARTPAPAAGPPLPAATAPTPLPPPAAPAPVKAAPPARDQLEPPPQPRPAPAAETPRRSRPARRRPRQSHRVDKAESKPSTWDPDSALPPGLQ